MDAGKKEAGKRPTGLNLKHVLDAPNVKALPTFRATPGVEAKKREENQPGENRPRRHDSQGSPVDVIEPNVGSQANENRERRPPAF